MKKIVFAVLALLCTSIAFEGSVPAGMLSGGRSSGGGGFVALQPTGAVLWELIKKADYRNKYKAWPGKTSFCESKEPHGALVTTYVNIPAFMSIAGKKGMLADGSIVVTENYSSDKKLQNITVMQKVPAYNPAAGNWLWAKYAPDGKIEAEGKVDECIKCHSEKKDNDFIFSGPLK